MPPERLIVVTVRDIMTEHAVTVFPDTPLEEIIEIFSTSDFAGVPVVHRDGAPAGIITQYDLISQKNTLHIPTLIATLQSIKTHHAEKMVLDDTLGTALKLKADDVMNKEPLCIAGRATIDEAVRQFAEHHKVNPLVVIDEHGKCIGVLSRHDLLKTLAFKQSGRPPDVQESPYMNEHKEKMTARIMQRVKKEFVLVPTFTVRRGLLYGFGIFLLGILVMFLFIVRAEPVHYVPHVVVPIGSGAQLSLSLERARIKTGDIVRAHLLLDAREGLHIDRVVSALRYDPQRLALLQVVPNPSGSFSPDVQLVDVLRHVFILGWSSSGERDAANREIGVVEFRALDRGNTSIDFDFQEPRGGNGNAVVTGRDTGDVLDSADGATLIIE